MDTKHIEHIGDAPIMALHVFTKLAGINQVTAWRYRQKGWLTTVNICGRQFITGEEIERFKSRAIAGEFSRAPNMPPRRGGGAA